MVNARIVLLVLLLANAPSMVAAASLSFEEGIARNPRTATEMYREQHWIRREGEQPVERLVLYRCPNGSAFARKQIDYRPSVLAPNFMLDDHRAGYREGLRRSPGPAVFYRDNSRTPERSVSVDSAQLVVDAGFDEFIRKQWAPLLAGKSLPLNFAVPSRLRSMSFSVSRAGEGQIAGEKSWLFRLKLTGLLGLIAPAIDVSYGQQSRRLLRFEGMSNLRDDAGRKPLITRIDFANPARAASDSQWQAALNEPLSSCRSGR